MIFQVSRAPGFFVGAPIVVDFDEVKERVTSNEAVSLVAVVSQTGLVPVGVANLGKAARGFDGPPVLSMASPTGGASLQWKETNTLLPFALNCFL